MNANQFTAQAGILQACVTAPDGQPHRCYTVGDDAATLAECYALAVDEAARLNNIGVTYRLERFVPECEGVTKIGAHWECTSVFTAAAAARTERDRLHTPEKPWRVLRQTREVLS